MVETIQTRDLCPSRAAQPGTGINPTDTNAIKCTCSHEEMCNPQTLNCGHTFCRECVVNTLEGPGIVKSQCPTCKQPAWKKELKTNHKYLALAEAAAQLASLLQQQQQQEDEALQLFDCGNGDDELGHVLEQESSLDEEQQQQQQQQRLPKPCSGGASATHSESDQQSVGHQQQADMQPEPTALDDHQQPGDASRHIFIHHSPVSQQQQQQQQFQQQHDIQDVQQQQVDEGLAVQRPKEGAECPFNCLQPPCEQPACHQPRAVGVDVPDALAVDVVEATEAPAPAANRSLEVASKAIAATTAAATSSVGAEPQLATSVCAQPQSSARVQQQQEEDAHCLPPEEYMIDAYQHFQSLLFDVVQQQTHCVHQQQQHWQPTVQDEVLQAVQQLPAPAGALLMRLRDDMQLIHHMIEHAQHSMQQPQPQLAASILHHGHTPSPVPVTAASPGATQVAGTQHDVQGVGPGPSNVGQADVAGAATSEAAGCELPGARGDDAKQQVQRFRTASCTLHDVQLQLQQDQDQGQQELHQELQDQDQGQQELHQELQDQDQGQQELHRELHDEFQRPQQFQVDHQTTACLLEGLELTRSRVGHRSGRSRRCSRHTRAVGTCSAGLEPQMARPATGEPGKPTALVSTPGQAKADIACGLVAGQTPALPLLVAVFPARSETQQPIKQPAAEVFSEEPESLSAGPTQQPPGVVDMHHMAEEHTRTDANRRKRSLHDSTAGAMMSDSQQTRSGRSLRKRQKPQAGAQVGAASTILALSLVGAQVEVWWVDDQQFYTGRITSYNKGTGKHTVQYDDDDVEALVLDKEIWKLKSNSPEAQQRQQQERLLTTQQGDQATTRQHQPPDTQDASRQLCNRHKSARIQWGPEKLCEDAVVQCDPVAAAAARINKARAEAAARRNAGPAGGRTHSAACKAHKQGTRRVISADDTSDSGFSDSRASDMSSGDDDEYLVEADSDADSDDMSLPTAAGTNANCPGSRRRCSPVVCAEDFLTVERGRSSRRLGHLPAQHRKQQQQVGRRANGWNQKLQRKVTRKPPLTPSQGGDAADLLEDESSAQQQQHHQQPPARASGTVVSRRERRQQVQQQRLEQEQQAAWANFSQDLDEQFAGLSAPDTSLAFSDVTAPETKCIAGGSADAGQEQQQAVCGFVNAVDTHAAFNSPHHLERSHVEKPQQQQQESQQHLGVAEAVCTAQQQHQQQQRLDAEPCLVKKSSSSVADPASYAELLQHRHHGPANQLTAGPYCDLISESFATSSSSCNTSQDTSDKKVSPRPASKQASPGHPRTVETDAAARSQQATQLFGCVQQQQQSRSCLKDAAKGRSGVTRLADGSGANGGAGHTRSTLGELDSRNRAVLGHTNGHCTAGVTAASTAALQRHQHQQCGASKSLRQVMQQQQQQEQADDEGPACVDHTLSRRAAASRQLAVMQAADGSVRQSSERPVVSFLGFDKTEMQSFRQPLSDLGADVASKVNLRCTTQLVVKLDGNGRFMAAGGKALYIALLTGVPVVRLAWLQDSLAQGRLLPPDGYLAKGVLLPVPVDGGPQRSLEAAQQQRRLFSCMTFVLAASANPAVVQRRDALALLVTYGGGVPIKLQPGTTTAVCAPAAGQSEAEHAAGWQQKHGWRRFVVVFGDFGPQEVSALCHHWGVQHALGAMYLLGCIVAFTILDEAEFKLSGST